MRILALLPAAALATAPLASCSTEPLSDVDEALVGGLELNGPTGLAHPLSQVVHMEVQTPGGTYVQGTGTRVGKRHLLTAAHNLRDFAPGAPIRLFHRTSLSEPAALIGDFSPHQPLTLYQEGRPYQDSLTYGDVAMITLDARKSGYAALEALDDNVAISTVGDGSMAWTLLEQFGEPQAVLVLAGYGCNRRLHVHDAATDAPERDDANGTQLGTGVVRFGTAHVTPWPTGADFPALDKTKYFVTKGHLIDRGDPDDPDDDVLTGAGTSYCKVDSGGPVLGGGSGVMGVASHAHYTSNSTYLLNIAAIPDKRWTGRVVAMPIIDVVASQLDGLDPTLERAGRTVEVHPSMPGSDVLYVKGYDLEGVEWALGGEPLPPHTVELLPRDQQAEALQLDTVKITFAPGAPAQRGLLSAWPTGDQAREPAMATTSASEVSVQVERDAAWRRYSVYRALSCGETYQSVTASCADAGEGMTELTVVRSTVYETQVSSQPVRLERIESSAPLMTWDAAQVVNLIPRRPMTVGSYQYITTSCNPNGSGCAMIHFDFDYQEESLVEQSGDVCRFRSRGSHAIVPWIYLLGERFELTEMMQDLIDTMMQGAFLQSAEAPVDDAPAACDAVLSSHPAAAPFDAADDGTIVPHAGWVAI